MWKYYIYYLRSYFKDRPRDSKVKTSLRDSIIHLTLSICSAGNQNQWQIQGRGPGDPRPLFLDQTEARRAKKLFFGRPGPSLPPFPPSPLLYLKNRARYPHLADHFSGIIAYSKISTLKSGFKKLRIRMPDSPDTFGRKLNPERKSCGFKNIQIRVDRTWVSADRHYAEKRCV